MFLWGQCHQHYHYQAFMNYQLDNMVGFKVSGLRGYKAAYCMEDSRRTLDGPGISCTKKYDCGNQGIQRGWTDR